MRIRLAVWASAALASAGSLPGADFYVSTDGRDSNPGTVEQPFRTIGHAYKHAAPGVTIHVLPGVYDDYSWDYGIHLRKSGTAERPIVLRSEVRVGAIIDGRNASDRNQGFYIDGCYNVVDGFEIQHCPHGGIAIYADGNRIIHNDIHHNGNPPSASTNGRDGIYSEKGTRGNFYEGNSIHDNGRAGSNRDHGLYLCGKDEVVLNNVLFRNAACGLQIAGYSTVSNMRVCNNVMAWNGTSGIILWMRVKGVEIRNNILYRNGHWGLNSYEAHGGGVVVDHNLVFGNRDGDYNFTGGRSDFAYTVGQTLSADPCFVKGACADFDAHLAPGSPAIGAGANLHEVFASSRDGAERPASGAWDLGPYVARHPEAARTGP